MTEKNKFPNLATHFLDIALPNPFLLASAPPTATGDMIKRAFQAGWGGAVIKTLHPDALPMKDLTPRFASLKTNQGEIIGFENCETLSKRPLQTWLQEIKDIKAAFPQHALIASIMAEVKKQEWQTMASLVAQAGVNALELNFSCPNGLPDQGLGSVIGQNPDMTRDITQWVKEAVDIPVIVKLTPNVTDIRPIAQAAITGGADALSAINTVQGLIGVDIDNLHPLPDIQGFSTYGGYSGLAVKPIGLRIIAQLSTHTSLPLMGIGGISTWQDAVEYLLLGAGCVQLCTAVMLQGYQLIAALQEGLSTYLKEKDFSCLEEMVGLVTSKLKDHTTLHQRAKQKVQACRDNCIGCNQCVISCRDAGYQALALDAKKTILVHAERCDGCGLCQQVCPRQVFSFA